MIFYIINTDLYFDTEDLQINGTSKYQIISWIEANIMPIKYLGLQTWWYNEEENTFYFFREIDLIACKLRWS